MKKLPLAAAVLLAPVAMSSQAALCVGQLCRYQNAAVADAITTAAVLPTNTFYTYPTPGGTSVINAPRRELFYAGRDDWTFDFTNLNAVTFTGAITYGDYETQTNVTGPATMQGHVKYTGVKHSFSGTGVYNEITNTFTYTKVAGAINTGGGSVYTAAAPATCINGQTSPLGKVCTNWAATTGAWEGLALNFIFYEDRHSFWGSVIGTEKGGTGLAATTTTSNWQVGFLPVPAAAWLFGSALVGLAGIKRLRK